MQTFSELIMKIVMFPTCRESPYTMLAVPIKYFVIEWTSKLYDSLQPNAEQVEANMARVMFDWFLNGRI